MDMETYFTEGDLPGEIWNPVVLPDRYENRYRFSGLYEVSNMGRVRSVTRKVFVTNGDYSKKIWEYPWYTHLGQLITPSMKYHIWLYSPEGKNTDIPISVLVALAFIPNPNNYKYVLPKDEDRSNCCDSNLYWSNSIFTESEKKNIGEANKDKPKSEEHKAKISEAVREAMNRPEIKEKRRKAIKVKVAKAVYCVTNNTIYESCKEAEKELLGKITCGTISWACQGKYRRGNGHVYKKLGLEFWYLKEWEELYGPISR